MSADLITTPAVESYSTSRSSRGGSQGETIGESGHAGFKTKTDANGEFTTERWADEMFVFAVAPDQRLAAYTTISAEDKELELILKPSAMIHGSALDGDGKPAAGKQIQLTFTRIVGEGAVNFWSKTDADGKFAFPAAPGMACTLYLRNGNKFSKPKSLTIENTKRYELDPFEVQGVD